MYDVRRKVRLVRRAICNNIEPATLPKELRDQDPVPIPVGAADFIRDREDAQFLLSSLRSGAVATVGIYT